MSNLPHTIRNNVRTNSQQMMENFDFVENYTMWCDYIFLAYVSADYTILDTTEVTIDFDAEIYDLGSDYDAVTTKEYTIPESGYYHFYAQVCFTRTADILAAILTIKKTSGATTTSLAIAEHGDDDVIDQVALETETLDYFEAGDTVFVTGWCNTNSNANWTVNSGRSNTFFGGKFIGF